MQAKIRPLQVEARGLSVCCPPGLHGVRESVNKSAASAASLVYVKFQAVIKSAASAAALAEAALAADWITAFFVQFLGALAPKKCQKIIKISGSVLMLSQQVLLHSITGAWVGSLRSQQRVCVCSGSQR